MFKFKLVEREDPAHRGLGGKLFATPNFLEFLPFQMKLGYGVRLNDFGLLRIAFSSEGVDNQEDFDVSKIKRPRVTFFTSSKLRIEISNIKYNIVK